MNLLACVLCRKNGGGGEAILPIPLISLGLQPSDSSLFEELTHLLTWRVTNLLEGVIFHLRVTTRITVEEEKYDWFDIGLEKLLSGHNWKTRR